MHIEFENLKSHLPIVNMNTSAANEHGCGAMKIVNIIQKKESVLQT